MNHLIKKLQTAQKYATENRPKVGGFPFFADCLRQVGVKKNIWSLPGAQSIFLMEEGNYLEFRT